MSRPRRKYMVSSVRRVTVATQIPVPLNDAVRDIVKSLDVPPYRVTMQSFMESALRNEMDRIKKVKGDLNSHRSRRVPANHPLLNLTPEPKPQAQEIE